MKRLHPTSSSDRSEVDELDDDVKPDISGLPMRDDLATPPPGKQTKKARTPKASPSSASDNTSPQQSSSKKQQSGGAAPGPPPGQWTAEKRGILVDRIIAAGYKASDLDALAAESGRKGSLRDKAVRAVKGDVLGGIKAE